MSKKLDETEYYVTSGGKVPVKWTAPEVCVQLHSVYRANALLYERELNGSSHSLKCSYLVVMWSFSIF